MQLWGDSEEVNKGKNKRERWKKMVSIWKAGTCRLKAGQSRFQLDWNNSNYLFVASSCLVIISRNGKKEPSSDCSVKWGQRTRIMIIDDTSAFHYEVPLTLWHNRVPADKHCGHYWRYLHLRKTICSLCRQLFNTIHFVCETNNSLHYFSTAMYLSTIYWRPLWSIYQCRV